MDETSLRIVDCILRESGWNDINPDSLQHLELIFFPNALMSRNENGEKIEKFLLSFGYDRISIRHQMILIYCAMQVSRDYLRCKLSLKTAGGILGIPAEEAGLFLTVLMSRSKAMPN